MKVIDLGAFQSHHIRTEKYNSLLSIQETSTVFGGLIGNDIDVVI